MKIEAVIDSGAAESVAHADMALRVPMLESTGSKRGKTYMSACGEKLPNFEQKQLKVWTNEGNLAVATFQCADATRPCAVSQRSAIREIELSSKVEAASSRPERSVHEFQERAQSVLEMHAKEPGDQGSGFA